LDRHPGAVILTDQGKMGMVHKVNEVTHEHFSRLFMEAVEEFYEEWKEKNEGRMPDFEAALSRAKRQGVLPATVWTSKAEKS
jgi:hypothetical protein